MPSFVLTSLLRHACAWSGHYAPDVRVEPRHIRAEYDFQIKERRATCRAVLTVVSNDRTARLAIFAPLLAAAAQLV
jgi:hypothetical protein